MEIQGSKAGIDRVILALERGTFIEIERMESGTLPVVTDERGFRSY